MIGDGIKTEKNYKKIRRLQAELHLYGLRALVLIDGRHLNASCSGGKKATVADQIQCNYGDFVNVVYFNTL